MIRIECASKRRVSILSALDGGQALCCEGKSVVVRVRLRLIAKLLALHAEARPWNRGQTPGLDWFFAIFASPVDARVDGSDRLAHFSDRAGVHVECLNTNVTVRGSADHIERIGGCVDGQFRTVLKRTRQFLQFRA